MLQSIWNSGGKPDIIMLGGFNKQVFSTFTGRATPTEDTKAKKIVASVDVYESDFGKLKRRAQPVPARARRAGAADGDVGGRVSSGRKMVSIPLAKTGDSERRQMLSEYAWWRATKRPPAACSTTPRRSSAHRRAAR